MSLHENNTSSNSQSINRKLQETTRSFADPAKNTKDTDVTVANKKDSIMTQRSSSKEKIVIDDNRFLNLSGLSFENPNELNIRANHHANSKAISQEDTPIQLKTLNRLRLEIEGMRAGFEAYKEKFEFGYAVGIIR